LTIGGRSTETDRDLAAGMLRDARGESLTTIDEAFRATTQEEADLVYEALWQDVGGSE
jgi:hypothetical protein